MFSEFKQKCSSNYLCPQGVVLGSKQMSRQICTKNNPQVILQHHQERNHRSNHNQMNPPYRTRKHFPEPIHTWQLASGICLLARPRCLFFPTTTGFSFSLTFAFFLPSTVPPIKARPRTPKQAHKDFDMEEIGRTNYIPAATSGLSSSSSARTTGGITAEVSLRDLLFLQERGIQRGIKKFTKKTGEGD
jgi:hypothetical protein